MEVPYSRVCYELWLQFGIDELSVVPIQHVVESGQFEW